MAAFLAPTPSVAATTALSGLDTKHGAAAAPGSKVAKARATAEDFESMFLNSMFQQMFANVGEGPFSGGQGATIWRSFLTDEYAKSFVKAGGIGIADEVQRALLAHQEAA